MKKMIYKSLLCITVTAFLAVSCKKQLEVAPQSSIDEETALKTKSGIEGNITSIYSNLKAQVMYGRDMLALPDALGDNGHATNHSGRLIPEARNQINAHFVNWSNWYYNINSINLVLDAIANNSAIKPAPTSTELNRWEGQLRFLRALSYFNLAREYAYIPGAVVAAQDRGGIPLMLSGIRTAEFASASKPARASLADVYNQIYADLTIAETKLTNSEPEFPFRANRAAAQGLFALVALYNKDYVKAKAEADLAIASHGTRLTTTATTVSGWRAPVHPESLFEVGFATAAESLGVNVSMQSSFTSLTAPGNTTVAGWGDLGAHRSLLADLGITLTSPASYGVTSASIAARNNDQRNLLFEAGSPGRGLVFIECTKFIGKNGVLYLDNIPVLRVADLYLIRAEAACADPAATTYNLANALTDLKRIKSNRITGYTGSAEETADNAMGQTALFNEVIRQRRIEFAMEGHRLFDLKRLGRDLIKSPTYSDVLFNDYRILPAIPQGDLNLNPNLKQNFGY
jgi:starch-binding outer membrane protein, SusD/RagB family